MQASLQPLNRTVSITSNEHPNILHEMLQLKEAGILLFCTGVTVALVDRENSP